MRLWRTVLGVVLVACGGLGIAAEAPADTIMGEYAGTFTPTEGAAFKGEAKVIAEGGGAYRAVLLYTPAGEGAKQVRFELTGTLKDEELPLAGSAGGAQWKGTLAQEQLTASAEGPKGGKFDLKRAVRHSPTEGQKPPAGALVLLPYEEGKETSLDEWDKKWLLLPDASIQVKGGDIRTKRQFAGDFQLHVEFRVPFMPDKRGQGRGNSGVYLQDRYEIQVLDSFGLVMGGGDCGAVYGQYAPTCNPCLPPLAWQTFDITFHAPRLDADGKKVEPARVTILLNGVKIHDNVAIKGMTGAARGKEGEPGAIRLQDHGNPMRFRNIWLVELKAKPAE